MNPDLKNVEQRLKQSQGKKTGNAHDFRQFDCPPTPAPTPPVSSSDSRKSGVGAGLSDSRIIVGVGVKYEEVEEKTKGESQKQSQNQHRGKPPLESLKRLAGFSTPFPEGLTPLGSIVFSTSYKRVHHGS